MAHQGRQAAVVGDVDEERQLCIGRATARVGGHRLIGRADEHGSFVVFYGDVERDGRLIPCAIADVISYIAGAKREDLHRRSIRVNGLAGVAVHAVLVSESVGHDGLIAQSGFGSAVATDVVDGKLASLEGRVIGNERNFHQAVGRPIVEDSHGYGKIRDGAVTLLGGEVGLAEQGAVFAIDEEVLRGLLCICVLQVDGERNVRGSHGRRGRYRNLKKHGVHDDLKGIARAGSDGHELAHIWRKLKDAAIFRNRQGAHGQGCFANARVGAYGRVLWHYQKDRRQGIQHREGRHTGVGISALIHDDETDVLSGKYTCRIALARGRQRGRHAAICIFQLPDEQAVGRTDVAGHSLCQIVEPVVKTLIHILAAVYGHVLRLLGEYRRQGVFDVNDLQETVHIGASVLDVPGALNGIGILANYVGDVALVESGNGRIALVHQIGGLPRDVEVAGVHAIQIKGVGGRCK